MSTRSNIIVHMTTSEWATIYCHSDGYPSHLGATLVQHYAAQELAERLIALGDLSALYASPDAPEGHRFGSAVPGYCIAYGRDRGETGTAARVATTLAEALPEADGAIEYAYVWDNGEWWALRPRRDEWSKPATIAKALTWRHA